MNLKNKVIVITGASSGIGKELALQFSGKGAKVVLAARNKAAMDDTAKQIEANGGEALVVPTDVSQRPQVENLAKQTFEHFGRIDVFINNAGVSNAVGPLVYSKEEEVRSTMDVNYMGCVYGVWAAAPYMEKQKEGGQMVFVSSCIGKRGVPLNSAYCASKFAVQGLTESIRPELKRKNIHVLTVCPPGVDTPFFDHNRRSGVKRYKLHSVQKIGKMIVNACEKQKREVLLTMDSKLLHWLNFYFPRLMDWALTKNKGL